MLFSVPDFVTPLVAYGEKLMHSAARLAHVADGAVLLVPENYTMSRYTNVPSGTSVGTTQATLSGISNSAVGTNAQISAAVSALQAADLANVQAVHVAGQALLQATPATVGTLLQTYLRAIQNSAPYDAITILLDLANSQSITKLDETFSRNSTGTYINAVGGISNAAANVLRYNGDLALVENAATNLCQASQTIGAAGWSDFGVTMTANATTAPDGSSTASKIVALAAGTTKVNIGLPIVIGDTYTFSVFAKAGLYVGLRVTATGETAVATFDLQAGTVTSPDTPATITPLADGWYRLSTTITKTNTSDGFLLGMI